MATVDVNLISIIIFYACVALFFYINKKNITTQYYIFLLYRTQRGIKTLRKYAIYKTKSLRLMGNYYWLIEKQNKAFKWWKNAIKKGEQLEALPDLARTYFEVGKSLLDPKSKCTNLNGITAQQYLEKSRILFEEMDLQWDLEELERISAAVGRGSGHPGADRRTTAAVR